MCINFINASIKDECGRRMLLGDNTDEEAVILGLIRFQSIGV
jgi:hypothetical protein